jgi:hypothetical protein
MEWNLLLCDSTCSYSRAGETSSSLGHLNGASEGNRHKQAACYVVRRGVARGGRVVRSPQSARSKRRQTEYFGLKILFYTLKNLNKCAK